MAPTKDTVGREPQRKQALATPLLWIVEELRIMADHAVLLDQQIGQIAMQGVPFDSSALQGADRLRQELEGLHEYVLKLAETLGPDGLCSPEFAADTLKVRAQALRLRGLPAEAHSDDLW